MMTPGPIFLLATIADEQAAAGLSLAPGAVAAMHALRDLIRAQPWAREPSQAAPAAVVAPVPKPRKARAKAEPRPGSCAARDLAEARSWKAAGDARGASLERAILKCAKEEQAWIDAHPWDCSPEGKAWYAAHSFNGQRALAAEAEQAAREAEQAAA
jgi:hypothetical protein